MDEEDEKEFVSLANEFVQKCHLNVSVERLSDCKDEFFVSLYQGLIGDNLKGLIPTPGTQDERVQNCQCVIDGLAKDVLNVDLSHISAVGIANGDSISIRNLLEIFSGLLEYFMECISENDFEDDFDDSNIITTEHDVLSSLLKEEFGSSSKDAKRHSSVEHLESNRKGEANLEPSLTSSYYNKGIHSTRDTRMSTEPVSFRTSTFTASGHEADMSEISDSTNELIKLGESSSSSGNSTSRKMPSMAKSLGSFHQRPAQTTWKQSMLSSKAESNDLTQYTLSSDEGDKDSLIDAKLDGSNQNLSSSLVSSTSSWHQQISPLDVDNNGIQLESLGVRPKVESLAAAGKESKNSSEDSGSGRSSPVLHHHYHHHFHHPVGAESKAHKAVTSTSAHYDAGNYQDYSRYPGNFRTSAIGATGGASQESGVGSHAILPVTEYSHTTKTNLHGKSDDILAVAGQSTRADIPRGSLLDSTSKGAGLPGQGDKTSVPSSGHSIGDTRFPWQRMSSHSKPHAPLSKYSRPGSGLPGLSTASGMASNSFPSYTSTQSGLAETSLINHGVSGAALSDFSRLETSKSVAGPSATIDTTSKGYSSTVSSLAGKGQPSLPLPDHSGLAAGATCQTTDGRAAAKASSKYSTRESGLPGPSHTSNGVLPLRLGAGSTAGPTTSGAFQQRALVERYLPKGTSLASTLPSSLTTSIPSSSGLHLVSSGGLTDSVFTGTGTSDLRNKFPPLTSKSLDLKQSKETKENSKLGTSQQKVSTESPLPSKYLDQLEGKTAPLKNQVPDQELDVDSLSSDDDDDDDDARYSDSAIDYSRDRAPVDSEGESEDSILRRIHDRWKSLRTSQSSKSIPARRAVTFNEDIETIPITSRMDRLRRLLEEEAEEQRQQTSALRDTYADQLLDLQKQHQQERKEMKKRKVQSAPLVPKKKAKKPIPSKQRGRLEAIYRPQSRPGRASKRAPVKSRKRSASASPHIGRRRKTNTLADFHETLLPSLFEEFPFLHVSPQTTHAMWQKQAKQISLLSKPESAAKKTKAQRNVEEAEKRQQQLLKILRKELDYNQRVRGERERQDHQRAVKAKTNEKRQIAARARRYYDEYQLRMRSKMLKRRTREEQILKRLFDDGLEIQKQRVRELRKYAKEKAETIEQKQTNEIESLENYYKDQFSMLAEGMTRERHELQVRQQAQEKVMRQMRHELRKKMEKEIQDLQETLTRDEDSAYFRQLEADRLRREFQLAMYKSDL